MSTNTNPTCPTDCTYYLPDNSYNACLSDIHTGEIERLYLMSPDGECFTDWSSLTEWNARLATSSVDVDSIRRFRVVGTMPVVTPNAIDISLGQKYWEEPERTVNIEIEDISDENYEFMRWLECQQTVMMWFETAGGDLFGGICGIEVNINGGLQIEVGQGSLHKMIWTATWKAKFSPERITSPMA